MSNRDNELIAEFMGAKESDGKYQIKCLNPESYEYGAMFWYEPENMLYSKSWDWLMPVCYKINNITLGVPSFMKCSVNIGNRRCEIKDGSLHGSTFNFEVYDRNHGNKYTTLEATYEAVVKFIEWWNLNFKTTFSIS
jgi:hypothetical protein